ncbi:unnamed protein product [Jaminaea pallidilutea]
MTAPNQETIDATLAEGFSREDRDFLGRIKVGCLNGGTNEYAGVRKHSPMVDKLTRRNWYAWNIRIRSNLSPIMFDRAIGILDSNVSGSHEAFARYYGTPASPDVPARKASDDEAKAALMREDKEIGAFMLDTISDELLPQVERANGMGSIMYQTLKAVFIPMNSASEYMIQERMDQYDGSSKELSTIVDDFRRFFTEFEAATGTTMQERAKLRYLFKVTKTNNRYFFAACNIQSAIMAGAMTETFDFVAQHMSNLLQANVMPQLTGLMPINAPQQPLIGYANQSVPQNSPPGLSHSPTSTNSTPSPQQRPQQINNAQVNDAYRGGKKVQCNWCANWGHVESVCQKKQRGLPSRANYVPLGSPGSFGPRPMQPQIQLFNQSGPAYQYSSQGVAQPQDREILPMFAAFNQPSHQNNNVNHNVSGLDGMNPSSGSHSMDHSMPEGRSFSG